MTTTTVIDQAERAIAALDLDYQKRRDALTAIVKQVKIAENARLALAHENDARLVAERVAAQAALALALQTGLLPLTEKLMDEIRLWRRTIRLATHQLRLSPGKQRELITAATTLAHNIGALAAAHPAAFANAAERDAWITQQLRYYCPIKEAVTVASADLPVAMRKVIGLRAYWVSYDKQINRAAMDAAR